MPCVVGLSPHGEPSATNAAAQSPRQPALCRRLPALLRPALVAYPNYPNNHYYFPILGRPPQNETRGISHVFCPRPPNIKDSKMKMPTSGLPFSIRFTDFCPWSFAFGSRAPSDIDPKTYYDARPTSSNRRRPTLVEAGSRTPCALSECLQRSPCNSQVRFQAGRPRARAQTR